MAVTLEELNVILSWFIFWFFVSSSGAGTMIYTYKWYVLNSNKIKGSPPSWIFGVVWPILFALLIAASSLYMLQAEGDRFYLPSFILLLVNGSLNYMWFPAFFDMRRFRVAFGIILGMIGTVIALVILWGLDTEFLPMALVIPYALWLCYAAFLNFQWTRIEIKPNRK